MEARQECASDQYSSGQYYDSSGNGEFSERGDTESLKATVEDLKTQLQQYKVVSQSFEKRVLDLQMEAIKKDEEIKSWREKYERCLAQKGSAHSGGGEGQETEAMKKLFVGGLSQSTTNESLLEYFQTYGTVVDSVVMKDVQTKKSRGFGFVIYSQASELDAAQAARPHTLDGKEVDTKRAVPKGQQGSAVKGQQGQGIQSRRIFIGGLKTTTEETEVQDYFKQFGVVESVTILEDKQTMRKRGFAYLTFSDSDVTDKVILQKYHMIDGRRCEVKPAFSKDVLKGPDGGNFGGNMGGNFGGNFGGNMGGNFGGMGRNFEGNYGRPFERNMDENFGGNMRGNFGSYGGHPDGNFGGGYHGGSYGGHPDGNFGGYPDGNYGGRSGGHPHPMDDYHGGGHNCCHGDGGGNRMDDMHSQGGKNFEAGYQNNARAEDSSTNWAGPRRATFERANQDAIQPETEVDKESSFYQRNEPSVETSESRNNYDSAWNQGRGESGGWSRGGGGGGSGGGGGGASRNSGGVDDTQGFGRGEGAFGSSSFNFRGDPGAGKPIRNTGNFLQRGSGPY